MAAALVGVGLGVGLGPTGTGRAQRAVLEARGAETPVHAGPSTHAPRRGTLGRGARVPSGAPVRGAGCDAGWVPVGHEGWVCGDDLSPVRDPDAPPDRPPEALGYAFVAFDATPLYAHPSDLALGRSDRSLGEGFGLVITGRSAAWGTPLARTRGGLWIAEGALDWASPSTLEGAAWDREGHPAFALGAGTPVHAAPGGRRTRALGRREVVWTTGRATGGWVELADGAGWVRDARVARARPRAAVDAAGPAAVGPDERWVEVDVREQVVIAWRGETPLRLMLAATGRPAHPTPLGEHRVWVKLAHTDMDDLERDDVRQNFAFEAVPWVMFFADDVGFHAALWHDDFGRPRSHGCVNLAPADARWLFAHAGPTLPDGWTAILPTPADPGTRVWVHD